tara:strand:+ start:287 stop:538 length:252 start_codon:yes stop_codon:yes gene_type:complete
MGKKRRLISAYRKFKAKHSNHPVILHNLDEDEELKIEEPVVEAKEEPVVVKEDEIEEPPKPKIRKKKTIRKRAPRKKTTKKEK